MINRLLDIIFPRTCATCNAVLSKHEKFICMTCESYIPITNLHRQKFNTLEQLFAGIVPIERATSLFYYHKQSSYAAIIHDIKYRNTPNLGEYLAAKLSRTPLNDGFFKGIDTIIPIPLHFTKLSMRGYNQSAYIAKGISHTTGIPIYNNLVAARIHETQTQMTRSQRWKNSDNMFRVKNPEQLQSKHILIVDDVITTGATISSAASAILTAASGTKISLLSLALAND